MHNVYLVPAAILIYSFRIDTLTFNNLDFKMSATTRIENKFDRQAAGESIYQPGDSRQEFVLLKFGEVLVSQLLRYVPETQTREEGH